MSKVVLLDFFATWCGPCKEQKPILDELMEKFKGKVELKTVDVDCEPELLRKYGVNAVPTLIIEKDGAIFKKYVGMTQAVVLERGLNDALGL